jgi:hypothetical protein
MVELRICPQCECAFYVAENDYSPICPHCGYVFVERGEERNMTSVEAMIYLRNRFKSGTVRDLSERGAMIVYLGNLLPVNSSFLIKINEMNLHRKAKVIWAKKIDQSLNATGVCFS